MAKTVTSSQTERVSVVYKCATLINEGKSFPSLYFMHRLLSGLKAHNKLHDHR